jgi:2,4-dienoyl-CoA reductase-like NADH-dependent reductase (Old Yellow Enzyme family)
LRAARLGREPVSTIEMTREKIKETVEKFGRAAARMKRAGMDNVMVHAPTPTLSGSLQAQVQPRRTDEYGGSTEKRAPSPMKSAIHTQALRRRLVIEYRISGDEEDPEACT